VTATLTGYQPLDQEVQGTMDWNGVDVTTIFGEPKTADFQIGDRVPARRKVPRLDLNCPSGRR